MESKHHKVEQRSAPGDSDGDMKSNGARATATANRVDGSGPVAMPGFAPAFAPSLLTLAPQFVTVGSVVPDFHAIATGRHPGNKHDAVIDVSLGGSAINSGSFGPANGIPTAAISA